MSDQMVNYLMKNNDNFEKKNVFTFRLKGSFLSVLLLIQVLMIGLSIAFGYLMISNLKDAEERRTQSVTKHIQNEVKHRIYRIPHNYSQASQTICMVLLFFLLVLMVSD